MAIPVEPGRSGPCFSAMTAACRARVQFLDCGQHRRVVCVALDQLRKVAQVDVGRGHLIAKDRLVSLGVGPRFRNYVLVHRLKRDGKVIQCRIEGGNLGQIDGGQGDLRRDLG